LNVLSDIEVCEQDVINIISTLNADKAVGHDIINNRMLLANKETGQSFDGRDLSPFLNKAMTCASFH
jgi:hypothetical protein